MLVSGILQFLIVFPSFIIFDIITIIIPEQPWFIFMKLISLFLMFMCYLSWVVITILMAVEWGKSFRECGPHLYNYGIFVIVMFSLSGVLGYMMKDPDEPGYAEKKNFLSSASPSWNRMSPEEQAEYIERQRKKKEEEE
jgi:hypothetical protein